MLEAIASHLDSLEAVAPVWGLPLVFAFMAVESSFIPFPSEVVMIPAGFLAARGVLGCGSPSAALAAAVAAGVAGSVAGAYVNYYLALKLGKPFLEKYGKYFFVKREPLDRACEVFNRYGAATTFVCRLVPVIRQLISIPAGISKMPLASFTMFTALGAGLWTVVLAATGYALGHSAGDMTYLELVKRGKSLASSHLPAVIGGAVALAAFYFLVSKLVMGGGRRGARHGECEEKASA
jgi:membrane protein DedA with SNARE-associated domain